MAVDFGVPFLEEEVLRIEAGVVANLEVDFGVTANLDADAGVPILVAVRVVPTLSGVIIVRGVVLIVLRGVNVGDECKGPDGVAVTIVGLSFSLNLPGVLLLDSMCSYKQ